MPKNESVWDKLLNIPQLVVAVAIFILMIIPMIKPLGLPVPIATPAKKYFDALEAVPDGSRIIFFHECSGSGWDEIKGGTVATIKYLWQRRFKVVYVSITAANVPCMVTAFAMANPEKYGVEYGEEWVFLGYIPGEEAAVAACASDLHAATSADYKGNPISDLEMMADIHSYQDIDLVITYFGDATGMEKYIRQWFVSYGIPQCWGTPAGNEAGCVPYMSAGMCEGYVSGPTGGATIEKLIHEPGEAARIADMKNLASIPIILLVILGNIAYFAKKLKKEG
jgi:hypothetical protein